jgi:hypothetical protein
MDHKRLTLEEFKALFGGRFDSQDELLREYRSFQRVFEHLDSLPVPEMPVGQKAEIFQRAWQERGQDRIRLWPVLLRRPAVAFAAGIVLGCALMFGVMNVRAGGLPSSTDVQRASLVPSGAADRTLTIEHAGRTQVYKGEIVKHLYPQIENPKVVLERAEGHSAPQRVLYGTLDDGNVTVVWNL